MYFLHKGECSTFSDFPVVPTATSGPLPKHIPPRINTLNLTGRSHVPSMRQRVVLQLTRRALEMVIWKIPLIPHRAASDHVCLLKHLHVCTTKHLGAKLFWLGLKSFESFSKFWTHVLTKWKCSVFWLICRNDPHQVHRYLLARFQLNKKKKTSAKWVNSTENFNKCSSASVWICLSLEGIVFSYNSPSNPTLK